ncbi:Sbal_3080 family lipoprotein [Rugamonas sp.]|uniref:Sbal_3080 family lipoprotein n=1 Tax=Rugamonas sp. TaxID=1926287 RepID=UPI0025EA8929|nr:Sbal_3080 family lipoprotein [Rugamonas sp.]
MATRSVLLFISGVALSGCAIQQTVKPVEHFADQQVCVIENPAVREGFVESYRHALETKGYVARQLPATASIIECPITSTYTANWRWDLAMYMSYADIKVYNNGKPIGEAVYDSRHAGGNMGKFINADHKITELVDQLFPGGAGR